MLVSAAMRMPRKLLASIALTTATLMVTAGSAVAQTIVDPQVVPEKNDGGWVYWLAIALAVLGVVIVIFLTIQYMRYAPRFSKDEEGLKVVRADRVRIGRELPRRNVDLSQAAPGRGRTSSHARRRRGRRAARSRAPLPRARCLQRPLPQRLRPQPRRLLPQPRRLLPSPPPPRPGPQQRPPRRLLPPHRRSQRIVLRSRWIRRHTRRLSRSCSTPAPIDASPKGKARRAGMIAARKKATGEA